MDHGHRRQPAELSRAASPPTRTAATIVVAVCLGLMAVSALQLWVARRAANEATTVGGVLLYGALAWLPWAATAPIILAVGHRFDFRRGARLRSLAVHLPLFLLCYAPFTAGLMYLGTWLFGSGGRPITTADVLAQVFAGTRMQLGVLVYSAILGLGLTVRTWQALRERELEASRLEAQAAVARLEALAARLQPHFLFNTLHAIAVLIEEDPARARSMIALLGDLLRDVIGGATEGEVTLRDELALLQRYLAIEQMRFADRLTVTVDARPETLEHRVPRLLLQPLAENALRHGLAPRATPGTLSISSALEDARLVLRVTNDGIPLPASAREGVGLSTTRERLATRRPPGSLVLGQRGAVVEAVIVLPPRNGAAG